MLGKKLELQWTNKGKALYYDIISGKYEWVDKKDPRVSEPRILIEKQQLGDKDTENLLIKGDNLLALKALVQDFANKIKLIYIDPPFHTGQAFDYYDDGLEHSIWLTMMRDRLDVLQKLLRNDGAIVVHIDYREEARLKVIMDEIFGSNNFRNSIIVKRGTKNVQQQFETIDSLSSGHDSLLLYTKHSTTRFSHCKSNLEEVQHGSWNNHWRGTDRPTMRYEIFGIKPNKGQWRWSKERTLNAIKNYEVYTEEHSDEMTVDDYYSMKLTEENLKLDFVRLSAKGKPEHYIPPKSFKIVSDIWMDVRTSGKETDFPHEKNEDLLFRLINWLTKPGDWVLDSFLGSGTTAIVAHKMRRNWIGIELGEHAETLCIPRLKKVVHGGDQRGISKQVKWVRGGGFKYFELGDSLFVRDSDLRLTVINPKMYNGALIRAVLKIEGFRLLNPDNALHGISGTTIAHVTEQYLSQAYIDILLNEIGEQAKFVIIYAKTISSKLKLPENVEVKRIPDILLKKFTV
jgi:adenine-specific DNA-methyltransferase